MLHTIEAFNTNLFGCATVHSRLLRSLEMVLSSQAQLDLHDGLRLRDALGVGPLSIHRLRFIEQELMRDAMMTLRAIDDPRGDDAA